MSPERLVHHELCFGCGRTNLFGLLMDMERVAEGLVRGRGFIKQDHQGAEIGTAHDGIIAAALSEAMAFACGPEMAPAEVQLRLRISAPVGSFLDVEAQAGDASGELQEADATAFVDGEAVASANGVYRRR